MKANDILRKVRHHKNVTFLLELTYKGRAILTLKLMWNNQQARLARKKNLRKKKSEF